MDPHAIEPKILPLVQALNATGLVKTFASCEGHFGEIDPTEARGPRQAHVMFEPEEGVTEDELVGLFRPILAAYAESQFPLEATLSIHKAFTPSFEEAEGSEDLLPCIEIFYWIIVTPCDDDASPAQAREAADGLLALIVATLRRPRA
jgi:hypothetical protein